MSWKTNPIMEWWDGDSWVKISDHGRSPLSISVDRIETKERMADGTLRRYVVAKKRTFSCSWDNLPDKNVSFLANGQSGEWMEEFYNDNDGAFAMRLRAGTDEATALAEALTRTGGDPALADNKREFTVMFSEYSKEVLKRGKTFDLWNISITLEEV
jgi:hypothetical protein